jgi:phosphatidylinositol alpha-1,6-mannosyltransferase
LGGIEPEALGIVFLEAAAAGLPVVVGRSGGAPETVVDGVTGQLVDPCDAPAVARAIGALLANPDRAREMGLRGRGWVAEHFAGGGAELLRGLLDDRASDAMD